LAAPVRKAILRILAEREAGVGTLAVLLGIRQSSTSQHPSKLRTQHLVELRKSKTTVLYHAAAAYIREIDRHLSVIPVTNSNWRMQVSLSTNR